MPAPKEYKPGSTGPRSHSAGVSTTPSKGRYNVVQPPPGPVVDDDSVEVVVDEVTVVVRDFSKYETRSLNAHVDPDIVGDVDEESEPAEPTREEPMVFGEWRTEAELEGTHYHRKDSRRI
jgi:hypothetical protein